MTAAPGSGIHVTFHRVVAFVVSAGICGVGGALWAETNRVVQASQFSVGFTFTVIAMLVLGGTNSVWGAVLGVVVYTALDVVLVSLQSGLTLGGYIVTIPDGTRPLALGAILILMLLFRPQGVTGGRELTWPPAGRRISRRHS
jgi:branched-chain amino acid transport system permease protein